MNITTPIFDNRLSRTGSTRFIANGANLKCNALLFDVSFTVPADYTGGWDFTRSIFVTAALRLGSGNGSAVNLISGVSLFSLLAYSDYIAGVSMASSQFKAGERARISGSIPIGFFSMGSRDSLDIVVNLGDPTSLPAEVQLTVSNVFEQVGQVVLYTYQSAKPSGADMPYTNILAVYYAGDKTINKNVVIRDQLGTQNTNIEDAIALSNAVGRFEFFTRFGRLYNEPYDLSQDISINCPPDDDKAEILLVGYHFDTTLLVSNAEEATAGRNNLVALIKKNDEEKYAYLAARGLV